MRKNVFCRTVFAVLATVLLTTVLFAEAQQTAKIPRIGLLYSVSASSGAPRNEAFR
jgi:hypothetical protein